MKKSFIGAMMLIAALIVTGCGNKDKKTEDTDTRKEETTANINKESEEMKENRMLIIVDPQIDFTTGSLATKKGPEAMDRLAQAIENGALENYTWVIITQDAHPANHCSFISKKNPKGFPAHCVQGTEGMNVYPALQKALENSNFNNYHYMTKGDLADKEEFSVFQNEKSGEKLRKIIEEYEQFEGIDICGIATDYCVFKTTKDLLEFYPAEKIRIVTNCIAAVNESDTKLADLMKEKGIEGINF